MNIEFSGTEIAGFHTAMRVIEQERAVISNATFYNSDLGLDVSEQNEDNLNDTALTLSKDGLRFGKGMFISEKGLDNLGEFLSARITVKLLFKILWFKIKRAFK